MKLLKKRRSTLTLGFFVLLLSVLLVAPTAAAETVYQQDFETGIGDWGPRGDGVVLEVVSDEAFSGENSLLVTGRTQNWNGPALAIDSIVDWKREYTFSVQVKLTEGFEESEVTISTENTAGENTTWDNIASARVNAEEWTEISGTYSIPDGMESITLYAESPVEELEFYLDSVKIIAEGDLVQEMETDIPSLAKSYEDYFSIGAAVEPYQLEGEHGKVLRKHFNSLTAENVMKPETIQGEMGEFNFSGGDLIREFANQNNMEMRGHTLVWHSQAADWMFEDQNGDLVSKEVLLDRMRTHIEETMKHFKGDVQSWDVVNEVIDPASDETDGLRNSLWYQIAGMDYIKEAFIHANKIDPEAKLYINDYSLLSDPAKRDIMYRVVKDLLAEDIPVDGIGMQGHLNIESPAISTMERSIEKFASLGVDLQVTELDVSVYTDDNQSYDNFSEELAIRQGHRYREIFNLFKQYSDQITNVTLWGIGDDHTWLTFHPVERNNWPLLFDQQLKAKPAFWGVVEPERLPVITKEFNTNYGNPVIDGQSDEIWENVGRMLNLEENEYLGGELKLSWDENNIYIYGKIDDQTLDADDSIEFFVNEDASMTEDAEIVHYELKRSGESSKDLEAAVEEYDNYYIIEAAIPVNTRELETGSEIAFDLKINDGDSGTSIIWNDFTQMQEKGAQNYGVLILDEAPVITRAIYGSPEINAELDEIWAEANIIETKKVISGDNPATAVIRTMWDEDYLYLYAEVEDPVLSVAGEQAHEQDSIEIFVDENNDKASEYQSDDTQYRVNYLNEQSFNPYREGFTTETRETETGYVVEAAVPFVEITAEEGMIIGFDVQVNDDANGDGSRDGVAIWNDESGEGWRNMSGLGNLILVK